MKIFSRSFHVDLMTLLSMSSRSSVDRATAMRSGGHGFVVPVGDSEFSLSHACAIMIASPFT